MSFGHAGSGVVRNHQRRNAAEVLERMHVRPQPRFHLLVARGLSPGVGARAQRGHKQLRWPCLAGVTVVHRNRRARPVHEHLLAGFVLLPQHHVKLRAPALVQLAEPRVAIAVRAGLPVFLPQQLQRHILTAAQLLVDRGEVWQGARRILLGDGWFPAREQRRVYSCFIPILGQRPTQARRLGALQVLVNCADADRAASPDLLVAQFEFESEAQNLP
jgi:hypothetical protein